MTSIGTLEHIIAITKEYKDAITLRSNTNREYFSMCARAASIGIEKPPRLEVRGSLETIAEDLLLRISGIMEKPDK